MKHALSLTLMGAILAGCGAGPHYTEVERMPMSNDMTVNRIASATCTRGNSPFKLGVNPDGSAVGRIIVPPVPKGAPKPEKLPDFAASLTPSGKRTVVLAIPAGSVTDEAVSETLSPVLTGGEVVLRGESFDCSNVKVRK